MTSGEGELKSVISKGKLIRIRHQEIDGLEREN